MLLGILNITNLQDYKRFPAYEVKSILIADMDIKTPTLFLAKERLWV